MKSKLLGGASAAVFAIVLASGVMAQDNEAEENVESVITQNANDEGALVGGNGNSVADSENVAAAAGTSTATQVDADNNDAVATNGSTANDDGAVVLGNGVALGEEAENNAVVGGDGVAIFADEPEIEDGSAVQIGNHNSAATANDEAAAANQSSVAIAVDGDLADNGSAVVVGNNNSTATADDGGAAVGGAGTAIGITDVDIGDFFLGNFATQASMAPFDEGTDDATLAFGKDNVVASAHLDSTVSGLVLAINYYDGRNENGDEKTTTIATGSIWGNSVSSAAGANRVVYNTGIANQGRALAVAGHSNFSNN